MAERPKKLSSEQAMAVAMTLVDRLIAEQEFPAEERHRFAADIVKHAGGNADGYRIGRDLEDYASWEISLGVCEILDVWWIECHDRLRAEQRAWLQAEKPQPPLPIGIAVTTPHGAGIIAGISEHGVAEYLVHTPDRSWKSAQEGLVVAFEDVRALEVISHTQGGQYD